MTRIKAQCLLLRLGFERFSKMVELCKDLAMDIMKEHELPAGAGFTQFYIEGTSDMLIAEFKWSEVAPGMVIIMFKQLAIHKPGDGMDVLQDLHDQYLKEGQKEGYRIKTDFEDDFQTI